MKPTSMVSNSVFIEQGLVEILGQDFVALSQRVDDLHLNLSTLKETAVRTLGQTETQGMFLRAGRAAFYYWMRLYSDNLGWREVDFRLLPAPARIKRALEDALKWFESEKFLKGEVSSTEEAWQISVTGLAGEGAGMDCGIFTGVIQELASWAGAGKFYPAREIECQSDTAGCCLFEISKLPAG